ncbi:MAG: F0F1 ATP synthase subunit alpha [Candidatus Omnitrophota bacterium]
MAPLQYKEIGYITTIRGCIVTVRGLENCINGQLVRFGFGNEGIIIGFDAVETQVLLVKQRTNLSTGDKAEMTLEPFNTPVGDSFIGRIVNPLGEPLDGLGPVIPEKYAPIFADAPSVMDRGPVDNTIETGIKIVDSMIPVGFGQRQLILGDKMTGKTTIGTDIILNQKGKDVKCIYCGIGKSKSAMDRVVALFKEHDAFKYTSIVTAIAGTTPGQQYLVPYIGSAIGEHFMYKGEKVIVIFDDFTKHAWAYRELSLLLQRPPGRESYPGDVFYLHSRMIERAAQLSKELGGGAMAFFPIIELLEGDLSGYISTNLVSMTDGQIYLSASLFGEGFKPAIDIGFSVSRIGSKAQWPAVKKVCKTMRFDYLQFRELLMVSRLKAGGTKTDEAGDEMKGGEILSDLLKQENDHPLEMVEEVIIFFGLSEKMVYDLDKEQLKEWKKSVYNFAKEKYPDLVKAIAEKKDLGDEEKEGLQSLYEEYIDLLNREFASKKPEEEEEDEAGPDDGAEENAEVAAEPAS